LVLAIPVLVFGTSMTFLIIRASPIDPVLAIIGPQGNQAMYNDIAQALGLQQADGTPVPLWEQYIDYITDLFTLNLGQSWVIQPSTPVWEVVASRAPQTIWLGFWSVLVAIFIGIPLGFYAGLNPNTWSDYTASFGGIVWRAMPNFWLAVILTSIMAIGAPLGWYQNFLVDTQVITSPDLTNLHRPVELFAAFKHILPAALVLGSSSMGNEMRIGRTAVLETINSNYVETAKAKGVPPASIVWKHVFRNALIPLVPIITGEAFILIGGSIIVETVFAINGIGSLFFAAAIQGDIPLLGSLAFIFILLTLGMNILQDLLYTIIDPRVGYESN
jgi:peptide/nickel transport system permease protein